MKPSRPFGSGVPGVAKRFRLTMFTTFRGRLAMLYIVVELSILLVAGSLLYVLLTRQAYSDIDEKLAEQAQSVVSELQRSPFYYWNEHLSSFSNHFMGTVQLVASNGQVLFATDDSLIGAGGDEISRALGQAMKGNVMVFVSTRSLLRKDNIRVVAMPIKRTDRVVAALLLGRSTSDTQAVFKLLYSLGFILGLISIVISAWAGYVMAKRAMRPIQEITSTARGVAAGDLSRRLTSFSQDREIRELIRSLNKMFGDLEASFQSQKRFTADASHELRLPLTVLKGEIEVALRQPRSPEEYHKVLHDQLDMIERMRRIVDDLLMLARADAGQLELEQGEVDLSLLLQEVGQQHLTLFASRHMMLEMDIVDDLFVSGDAAKLERVIFNLLNNAYKYAREATTVYLSAHAENEKAIISVRDEGPGIASHHLDHLFSRFYRADDGRARSEGGSGLGLAICKRIVLAHGGEISVESEEGGGTQFIVSLPLAGKDPELSERLNMVMRS